MKINIYTVVYISTDDCTYHSTEYHDTFSTQNEAEDYIRERCKTTDTKWPCFDKPEDYEIKIKILENVELIS